MLKTRLKKENNVENKVRLRLEPEDGEQHFPASEGRVASEPASKIFVFCCILKGVIFCLVGRAGGC